jgi:lipopolysaccharide/colanic/teichoic acid biosynthesis glycosyltransferase
MNPVLSALAVLAALTVLPVLQSLIAKESEGWLRTGAESLVRLAVRRLPADQRDRYEEEWNAEIAARSDRPLTVFVFAISLTRAARQMRGDRPVLAEAAHETFLRLLTAAVLVAITPLLVSCALAIVATSRGPLIYRSPRIGRRNRSLSLFKFRTTGSPTTSSTRRPVALRDRAALLTPVGGILQRYSIDEIPQLLNVLRGELALVGPRPLTLDAAMTLRTSYPKLYEVRQRVKPGMTGPWVLRPRKDLTLDEMLRIDADYVENRSLWLDLRILGATVAAVVRKTSAP